MPINLTTPFVNPNGTRLLITKVQPNEDDSIMFVTVQLRTSGASDHIVAERSIVIRNGLCDRLSRAVLSPGQRLEDWLIYEPSVLNIATGYTDAINAWRTGASASARRANLEAHLLAIGYLHSSLAGT